jgi:hypothetical protein
MLKKERCKHGTGSEDTLKLTCVCERLSAIYTCEDTNRFRLTAGVVECHKPVDNAVGLRLNIQVHRVKAMSYAL